MTAVTASGTTFETGCDLIDATSSHRPDTDWRIVDGAGHEHRWFFGDKPATEYNPSARYSVPSLKWVVDGVAYWEDGEPYDVGHHECRVCREHIEPGYTADAYTQYVPGLRWCRINGESVTREQFERALIAEGLLPPQGQDR
jgi:hypothetical protein